MTNKLFKQSHSITRQSCSKRLGLLTLLILGVGLVTAGCAGTSVPAGISPVTPFDVRRYQGTWYEIARLDHSFERGMSDVTATYIPEDDGSLRVINRGFLTEKGKWRQAAGKAVFRNGSDTGSLKVSFFGPFYAGYYVAALDPEYRWALIIGPNAGYAWILARDRTLSPSTKAAILQRASASGINIEDLIWVSQTRADALSAAKQ